MMGPPAGGRQTGRAESEPPKGEVRKGGRVGVFARLYSVAK